MKTDETVTFDYLKPDFSILKGRRIVMVNLQPEYQFYFKHRIVHWLNQMNQSFDPETSFDAVKIERYMVGDKGTALIVYGFKNLAGTLHFNYDKVGNFKNISFSTEVGIYNNQLKFPSTSQFFTVTADMNTHNEMLDYVVERSLDMSDTSYDDFMVKYSFTADGQKTKDLLILYDYKSKDENMIINDEVESVEKFDDFFNININDILKSPEAFVAIYPYFSVTQVNSNETLEVFYKELKEAYNNGVFDAGLPENLHVVKMAGI